jgi:conjugal transfer pilus assembly protein TraF
MMETRLSFFILLMTHTTLWGGWHDRKAEGWAWYEEQKQSKKEETPHEQPSTVIAQMQEVRKTIEEKLTKALLEPTPENIKSYMEEQQRWIERSSHFAQIWAQVLLNHPSLDYTATDMPISQYGLEFYKEELQKEKESLIASLASPMGFFSFMQGRAKSQVFLPISYKVFPRNMD